MFSKIIFLLLLSLISAAYTADIGLVGLGRTVFEPLCCYSCLASLWGLELSCTQSAVPDQPRGSDPFCHATSTPYLSSLAYCIRTKCAAENVSTNTAEECWSSVAGDGIAVSGLEDSFPRTAPTTELAYNGTSLDKTSLVNEQYYKVSRSTIQEYVKGEYAHALYGAVLIFAVVGFCCLLGILRALNYLAPELSLPRPLSSFLQKYITSPALVGSLHLRPFPKSLGYIPLRFLSILIVIYIILNAILCAINYPTPLPNTWYLTKNKHLISLIADRLGILTFANITLAIMFAGRNTPILFLTGRSRTDILTFHRWVARVATVQGIVHVVLYWNDTNQFGYNMFMLSAGIHTIGYNPNYWDLGIMAVIAMSFMVFGFAMLPLRKKWYEIFLFMHIALAITVLVGLWYHVVWRFDRRFGYETWLYIAFAFWGFDRLVRVGRLVLCNWRQWTMIGHPKAVVELLPGGEFVKVTVWPSVKWKVRPGQHCYLQFPTVGRNPFQSHPFSIADWDEGGPEVAIHDTRGVMRELLPQSTESEVELQSVSLDHVPASALRPKILSISFIIRPEHGLTQHLHRYLVQAGNTPVRPITVPVWIEGPYGLTTLESDFCDADTVLALAGGIGITSILGYLKVHLAAIGQQETRKELGKTSRRFILFWSAREESLIKVVRSQLGDIGALRNKGVELRIFCTASTEGERVSIQELVRGEVRNWSQTFKEGGSRRVKLCVLSCSPGTMADLVRAAVVESIGIEGVDVRLIEDSFCW